MTPQQPKPSSIDWITLLLYFLFITIGLLSVYASVYKDTNPHIWDTSQNYGKQLIWIGISVFIGMLILLIDERFFFAFAYPIYGITIILLLLVLVAGTTVKGSSSWIEIGGFRMQPAEFAKFGTALALAKYLSGYNKNFAKKRIDQYISIAIILAPMVIILLQNQRLSLHKIEYQCFVF